MQARAAPPDKAASQSDSEDVCWNERYPEQFYLMAEVAWHPWKSLMAHYGDN